MIYVFIAIWSAVFHPLSRNEASTHTYYRTMASLPGDYTSQASCPGHDYPGALMAREKPSIGQVYAIHFWFLMGMIKIT